jgi:hypothetical protein
MTMTMSRDKLFRVLRVLRVVTVRGVVMATAMTTMTTTTTTMSAPARPTTATVTTMTAVATTAVTTCTLDRPVTAVRGGTFDRLSTTTPLGGGLTSLETRPRTTTPINPIGLKNGRRSRRLGNHSLRRRCNNSRLRLLKHVNLSKVD